MSETSTSENSSAPAKVEAKPARALVPVQDDSDMASLMDSGRFEHLWRVAQMFSKTDIVPGHFKGKPENCLIALASAMRTGVDPMLFLQHTYVVSGKMGLDGQLVIAMLNSRGRLKGGVKFKWVGTKDQDDYGCQAWGIDATTGEVLEGPAVTMATVKSEHWMEVYDKDSGRWTEKKDSKWKSDGVRDLMFMYRSGSWFGRTHRPEVTLGFSTLEEFEDIGTQPRNVTHAPELLPSQIAEQAAGESAASSAETVAETASTEGTEARIEPTAERQAEDPDAPLNEARVKAIETAIKSVSMTDLQRKQFLATYEAETVEQIKNAAFQEVLRALMSWKAPKGK